MEDIEIKYTERGFSDAWFLWTPNIQGAHLSPSARARELLQRKTLLYVNPNPYFLSHQFQLSH
jgi:hypothetical protein